MPAPGLSLVGFMDQASAVVHLRDFCVPADPGDAALVDAWQAARARIGPAIANAGLPEVLPIPDSQRDHIDQVARLPNVAPLLAAQPDLCFRMVEIDPLLSFQFTVSSANASLHTGHLGVAPSLDALMEVCLPLQQSSESSRIARAPQSILLKTSSLNVRLESAGMLSPGVLGVRFGIDLPLVRIVRHEGRCYLRNGFHRAVGLRNAGVTHVPCLFRDGAGQDAVGIKTDGTTFTPALMRSRNPPTLAHFTSGRAHPVMLRTMSKVLHISWAEYVVAEDI